MSATESTAGTIATYNPVSYMVEGLRSLVIAGSSAGPDASGANRIYLVGPGEDRLLRSVPRDAALREDLILLAMSATAQAARLAAVLGDVPVVETSGALHPVEVRWCPPPEPAPPIPAVAVSSGPPAESLI